MGLGAPKRRAKISNDPNNTAWSRSSTKYGQKILQSQGWVPGDYLGIKDAPHASLHSAASASHIRIAHKDDNLGLGAKRGANDDEGKTTGLDAFQDLLGRLNGKSNMELGKQQIARSSMRRSAFVEQRWGRLQFVKGGLLVGDKLQDTLIEQPGVASMNKRNTSEPEEMTTGGLTTCVSRSPKNANKRRPEGEQMVRCESNEGRSKTVRPAKDKQSSQTSTLPENCVLQDMDRAKRKAEKALRKLKRKTKQEASNPPTNEADHTNPELGLLIRVPARIVGGRNAVRQRHIQHKKMAVLDRKALNEILMIKT